VSHTLHIHHVLLSFLLRQLLDDAVIDQILPHCELASRPCLVLGELEDNAVDFVCVLLMQINIVWSFSNECAVLVRGSVSLI
jgi:hypothetical protein